MATPIDVFGSPDTEADKEAEKAKAQADISWLEAFKFLGRRLMKYPGLIALTVFLSLVSTAASLVSLSLIFPFLETLQSGDASLAGSSKLAFLVPYFNRFSTITQIQIIAVSLVGLQLVKGGVKYASNRLISYQRVLFDLDLRQDVFDRIFSLEMRYINQEKIANLYSILREFSSDSASAAKRLLKIFPRSAKLIGYGLAMVLVSWKLTLASLVMAAITFKLIDVVISYVRRMSRKLNELRIRLKHRALESLNGIKVIHLFGREDHARQQYHDELRTYQQNKYQQASAGAAVGPIYSTLMTGMVAGILVAGTILLDTAATVWVALLTAFMVVLFRLMGPTKQFASMKTTLAKRLPSVGKVRDFLDESDKLFLEDGDRRLRTIDRGLELEDVWFRYDEGDDWALRDVSIDIPKGSTVALVGSSGAGKSTTVDLIARLYDPTRGQVRVDGRDLREHRIRDWRKRLAVVSQDTFLFNETAMENIRFGRLDATDEEVREAARRANAHTFIQEFPKGYDTQLGERGVRLSGGQKQRLAIARAILADPDLLLLDEATSSLDTNTERQVQQALDDVSRDRTVVAIAHRLSTIKDADQIIVLEDGEVVERGTHEELLEEEGHYWEYVQMQDLTGEDERLAQASAASANGTDGEREAPRVVLGSGSAHAAVKRNGETLGEAPLIPIEADQDPGRVLADADGDAVVVQEGRGHAWARIGDRTVADLPLYRINGEAEEIRVRVEELREGRADDGPR